MKKDYGKKMSENKIYTKILAQMTRRPAYAAGAGVVILAIFIVALSSRRGNPAADSNEPYYKVKSGPLTISVSESGRLKNKDEIVIENESGKSLKVIFLMEEGTMVKKGDLIVELDSTTLEDTRQNYDINVKNGEANLIAAQENLEITKNQAKTDVSKAELTYKFAQLDQEKYSKGLHPQELEKADAAILLAQENLQRAEQDYTWSQQLQEKGFITLKELQADELSVKQKKITLRQAELDREILVKYTQPEDVETLLANVEQGEMALERARRKATADVVKAQANLLAQESELSTLKQKLAKAEEQLIACKMVAPADGMVVYATSSGGWRGSEREQMDVGATVQPGHKLIRMPKSDIMLAELSVQEASKPKLVENMAAVVTVDALPGKIFRGKLTKIGILPDSTQSWLNPDLKVYLCEVQLDEGNAKMRPGMNCHVEIVIEDYEKALFVPIQCVLQVDGKPTVYIKTHSGGSKRRVVQAGLNNNVMIHILSGLEDGEEVMLNPPLQEAARNGGRKNNGSVPAGKSGKNRQQDTK